MSSMLPLGSALSVDWILEEPCLVTWKDINNEPKNLGNEPHPVTLWVGVRKTDRVWVVMLQRTISFKYSTRSKPFSFFVFLDPRSLRIDEEPVSTSSSAVDKLLKAHPSSLEYGWLSGSVRQDQLQTPGRVLMRQQLPNDKAWDGTPLHLLMQIQSLAEAPEFQIYLGNRKHVRKVINRLEHELPKRLPAVHIDLSKVYEGTNGVWDAWRSYSDEFCGLKRVGQPGVPKSPPPYDEDLAQLTNNPQELSTPSLSKRHCETQEEDSNRKRIRAWEWANASYPPGSPTEENTPSSTREWLSQKSTVDNQSTQADLSTREAQPSQDARSSPDQPSHDQSHQGYLLTQAVQRTPDHPQALDHNSSFSDPQDIQAPPYSASLFSSESDNQVGIKPTTFTTKPWVQSPPTITLTAAELQHIIATAIQSQITHIAAQVQDHFLASDLTALAQPSIADYISTHMPVLMQEALSAHVSDIHDEWQSAETSLHESKDDAITEIRSTEETAVEQLRHESQVAIDELQEQSQRLAEDLEDKYTELEDRLDAKMSAAAPPGYTRDASSAKNSTGEAIKVFERVHRGRLTPEEQVRVLLSLAKWHNADVFVATDLESQKMLVAHWSGRKDFVSPSPPLPLLNE